MSRIKSITKIIIEAVNIIRLWILSFFKPVIGYATFHPIFLSVFKDSPPEGFLFYQRSKSDLIRPLENLLWKRCKLLHLNLNTKYLGNFTGSVIVECEADPLHEVLNNSQVKHIFVESKFAGRKVLGVNPKVSLLYPSVPVQTVPDKDPHKKEIKILAVGYGSFIKGYDVLYRIYKQLKSEGYTIKLIIAGTFGHNFDNYPEVSREAYDNANFDAILDFFQQDSDVFIKQCTRSELFDKIYREADIYVHFCRMETFGFSILEAMSFGLPVVSCRFNAVPEMVDHGENGYLVNPFIHDMNSPEWADVAFNEGIKYIRQLIDDTELRSKMGRESRNRINLTFNIENKKTILKKTYTQLL